MGLKRPSSRSNSRASKHRKSMHITDEMGGRRLIERDKKNFMPPFFCCEGALICPPIHEKVLKEWEVFRNFTRHTQGLSYHFHRHSIEDVTFFGMNKDVNVAFKLFMHIPHTREGTDEDDPEIDWETCWVDFFAPCKSIFMNSANGVGRARDNKVHSCGGFGLAKVSEDYIDEGNFRFTGAMLDLYCCKHNYYFRVAKLQSGGPESDYEEAKNTAPISSRAVSPERSQFSTSFSEMESDEMEDSFILANVPSRRRVTRSREATILEHDWVVV